VFSTPPSSLVSVSSLRADEQTSRTSYDAKIDFGINHVGVCIMLRSLWLYNMGTHTRREREIEMLANIDRCVAADNFVFT
jgi:hypothetical protein